MNAIQGFKYQPSPTGLKFHESDAKIKLVFGPYGSGKTCMIMNDALYYSISQKPAPDGVRYTTIGVVRGSYPELLATTRNSIMEVFPAQYGTILSNGSPIRGMYRFPVGDGPYDYLAERRPWHPGDGTIAQVDFQLWALSGPEDQEKVKSANWSFAIINEATSVSYECFMAVLGRIGRYPSMDMGGCTYAGVLMDTNQPPQGHYLLDMKANPEPNWEIFDQPPAAFKHEDELGNVTYEVNHAAENLRNLGSGKEPDDFDQWPKEKRDEWYHNKGVNYYWDQIAAWKHQGRTDKIDSLFCMLDVPIRDGKPVWPMFKYDLHVAKDVIEPLLYSPVIVGYDTSGIHPACAILQQNQGRWCLTDELYGDGMGLLDFVEQALVPLIRTKYVGCAVVVACDPANASDNLTGLAPTTHLAKMGFKAELIKTNDPKTRIRAVDNLLNKSIGGLIVSPHCSLSIKAFQGGYRYKRLRILGGSMGAAYDSKPDKNMYSHIADAIQYACMYIVQDSAPPARELPVARSLAQRRRILKRVM